MTTSLETISIQSALKSDRDEFGHAVMGALACDGATFSADVSSAMQVTGTATPLRLWLLVTRALAGGVSVTVSPEFLRDTYPAMLELSRALNEAGLKGTWEAEDERTFRLGKARHVFISVDRPVRTSGIGYDRPDTLLEVVSTERIEPEWYRSRVVPRSGAKGLTTVVYGTPEHGSLYDEIRARNLLEEWKSGVRRHFALRKVAPRAVEVS